MKKYSIKLKCNSSKVNALTPSHNSQNMKSPGITDSLVNEMEFVIAFLMTKKKFP